MLSKILQASLWLATLWMYIHNVKSENHNVATIIQNVAQNKKEKIQNIASDILNGDIMNGDVVDAPPKLWLKLLSKSGQTYGQNYSQNYNQSYGQN